MAKTLMTFCAMWAVLGCSSGGNQAGPEPENPQAESPQAAETQPPTEVSPAEPIVTPDAAVAPAPPVVREPVRTEKCLNACTRLLSEPFATVAPEVATECADDWSANVDNKCKEWDFLSNCVYAAGGKPFADESTRSNFKEYAWYKPKKSFKEKKLADVAKANIKFLKESRVSCKEAKLTKPGDAAQSIKADLDGDGTEEKIRLTTTRVFVDDAAFVHRLDPYSASSMKVKVIDLDTSDSFLELLVSNYYYEGNGSRRVVYKRDKGWQMSEKFNWHDGAVTIEGKGEIRMYSGECGQKRTEIYGMKKGAFVLKSKKVKGRFRERLCSACPYVFVRDQGHWEYQGEILRNLRAADLEDTHELHLGRRKGLVHVRLAERKAETTFVDTMELVARYDDGTEESLLSDTCSKTGTTWCKLDQRHHRIEQGEEIDVSVRLDRSAELVMRVRGYYLPH